MNTSDMDRTIRSLFATTFSLIFFLLSAAIILGMAKTALDGLLSGEDLMPVIIQLVNSGIIAIAVFELAMVINKEYGANTTDEHNVIVMLRRTLPRFIGTVCVALSLEGLIMVIKYSQLELAGNLYYPVAIIVSSALLLTALGLFLKLSPAE